MTLRRKISLISSVTALLIMLVFGFLLLTFVNQSLKQRDEEILAEAMDICKANVSSFITAEAMQLRQSTTKSLVAYHLRKYVAYTRGSDLWYSLSYKGESLFDNRLGEITDNIITKSDILKIGENEYEISVFKNTDATSAIIAKLSLFLIILVLLAGTSLFWLCFALIKIAVRPIGLVAKTALSIAGGHYDTRTNYKSADEIGQLSLAFDKMAEAVETELSQRKLLLAALTHEIKTPMTTIIASSDTLLHMPITVEQRHKCAELIYSAARRTEKLSKSVLELLSYTDYSPNIKSIDALAFSNSLKENYSIHIALKDDKITGDESLLFCLCINLIDNACRYSDKVFVELGNGKITVRDNGKGIPKEELANITKAFYRVDKARSRKDGGAGIGLALCEVIARAHRGELSFESELGIGTSATFLWKTQLDNI